MGLGNLDHRFRLAVRGAGRGRRSPARRRSSAGSSGSIIIIVLALVHAELGGLFPVSGGTSRFPHYAFGSFAGATFGWASYLQAASVAPIEVLAAIQYLSTAHWARNFLRQHAGLGRHAARVGYVAAAILMVCS